MENSEPGHGQYGPNHANVRMNDPVLVLDAEAAAFREARRGLQDTLAGIDEIFNRTFITATALVHSIRNDGIQGAQINPDAADAEITDLISSTESAHRLSVQHGNWHIQLRNTVETFQRKARLIAIEAKSRNPDIVARRLASYPFEAFYINEACRSPLRDPSPLFNRDFARDRLGEDHFPLFSAWFDKGLRQNVIADLLGVSAATINRFVHVDIPEVVWDLGRAGRVAEIAELIGLKAVVPPKADPGGLARTRRDLDAPDLILVNDQYIAVVEVKNFALPYNYPQTGVSHDGELIPGYCSLPEPDNDVLDGLWNYPGVYSDFELDLDQGTFEDAPDRVQHTSSLVPEYPMTTTLSLVSWPGTSDTDRMVALHWLDGVVSFHPAGSFRPWPWEMIETDGTDIAYTGPDNVDEWFLSCDPNDYARFINSFEKEPPSLARCLEVLAERHPPLGTYDGPSDASKFLEWLTGIGLDANRSEVDQVVDDIDDLPS